MGGKAFPNLNTIRLDKNGFMVVATACLDRLEKRFPDNQFRVIDSFRNKESFGDLDILWCGNPISQTDVAWVFKTSHIAPNGPVVSFALPLGEDQWFQVDLIHVDLQHLDSALSYFAFNDLGNLLGRIFHRAGFKLGHKGMTFVVREEGNFSHAIDEIEVTRDWKEALEFAGYDHDRWLQGFDELEDVFRYVVSSPYFDKKIFSLEPIEDDKE